MSWKARQEGGAHGGKWKESSPPVANRTTFGVGGLQLRGLDRRRREHTSKKLLGSRVRAVAVRRIFVRFLWIFEALFWTDEGAIGGAEERHGCACVLCPRFRLISRCYTHVVSLAVLLTLYKYRISSK